MISDRLAPCIPAAARNRGHNLTPPVKFLAQAMMSGSVTCAGQA
jgi:hypothetical protein